jgi:hypothetical protein
VLAPGRDYGRSPPPAEGGLGRRDTLELRYANAVLMLGKDQTAIEVGTKDKLVPTIETVIEAVKMGELDAAMNVVFASWKKPRKSA